MGTLENPVLETRHMRLVLALVDHGTTARAASALHLTQSAVSYQLTDLERRLGVLLFTREKRGLALTPAGAELAAASRRLLSEVASTEVALRQRTVRPRPRLRVSTECYTCYYWLPGALCALQAEHADLDVRIELEATRRPVAALLAGDLDVAIASSPISSPRIEGVTLFRDELVCAFAASHPLAKKPFVTAADLASEHLITYDVPEEEIAWLREQLAGKITPRTRSRVPLTEAIVELVRAGIGVSILARWAIEPHLRRGALVARSLTKRGVHRTWRALYRKGGDAHVRAFVKAIADARIEPSSASR